MSEVAIRAEQGTTELYQPAQDPTGGRLVAWAEAAHAANQLAKALSRTSFAPAAFRGNDGDATAAIIMGDELGLSPLAALRSIYVVHGAPAMYARTMVALAQSHGHQVWTESSTDAKVVVCGRRRGSEHVERSEWTIQRATKAGYTSNKKYASTPQEMLYAKAAAEVARKVAADVLAGVPYSVEDLELEPGTVTVSRSEPAASKRVQRKAKPEPVEPTEPEFDPEPEPPAAETPDLITEPQSKKLHALFRENGLDRDEAIETCRQEIGRDIESTKELTKAEASRIIDALDMDPEAEPEADQ